MENKIIEEIIRGKQRGIPEYVKAYKFFEVQINEYLRNKQQPVNAQGFTEEEVGFLQEAFPPDNTTGGKNTENAKQKNIKNIEKNLNPIKNVILKNIRNTVVM